MLSSEGIGTDIDLDAQETQEWLQALQGVLQEVGPERARFLLSRLSAAAQQWGVNWRDARNTPYVNTIRADQEPPFPGGSDAQVMEEHLASIMRWNALAMVVRANRAYGELGGHIASYASAADLFEVGFNHFFRARDAQDPAGFAGDLVYFQPHSAPGIYARAFLEGALSEQDLDFYRREIEAKKRGQQGLSSYPHPWLMPNFWQFPTGSMGIGPTMRFIRRASCVTWSIVVCCRTKDARCGAYSVTVKWMSPNRWPRSVWPRAKSSII